MKILFFIILASLSFTFSTIEVEARDSACGKKSCQCEHENDVLTTDGEPVDTEYSCRIARCEQRRDQAGNKKFCYYCKVKVGNKTIYKESIPARLGAKIGSGGDSLGLASSRVIRGYFSDFHDSFKQAIFDSRVSGYKLKPETQNYFQGLADTKRENIRRATTPQNEEQRIRFCRLGIISDPSLCDDTSEESSDTSREPTNDDSDDSEGLDDGEE
ncbi:hypothetical protein [Pseudobdellovibrio exovorus]|uniref:Uncharacterized protein n=1 Tax=Pseudobdellovibrio exovorus JSS TaxID=1184267 RepID=M4V9A3_9BACT|nr:hypothetical protein [Pseudobdellovibrio exovorus]AGH95808.1 hypothetical protein A11Q_1592 [Pseudobdellovibrio exovorus JSS]